MVLAWGFLSGGFCQGVYVQGFFVLSQLYWYIRELRIFLEEITTVLVQYCCLHQLSKNCYGGPAETEYLCLN